MTLPEGKAGKALALGLCGILLLLVALVVIRPLVEFHAGMRDELSLLVGQRVRLARLESELPRLQQQVAELKAEKQVDDAGLLLPDASDAVAAAALQTKLKALGASAGADINSVESLAPRRQDGFRRIGVRVAMTCDLQALTAILSGLATAKPPLFVDNLDVRYNGLAAQQTGDAAPMMNVGFDVYGYRADSAQTADSRG